jgi:hypothetical protein
LDRSMPCTSTSSSICSYGRAVLEAQSGLTGGIVRGLTNDRHRLAGTAVSQCEKIVGTGRAVGRSKVA